MIMFVVERRHVREYPLPPSPPYIQAEREGSLLLVGPTCGSIYLLLFRPLRPAGLSLDSSSIIVVIVRLRQAVVCLVRV